MIKSGLYSIFLVFLFTFLLAGCSSVNEKTYKAVAYEKVRSDSGVLEREIIIRRELGTIGKETDVFVEEEVDLSQYPKTVTVDDLTYEVEPFEGEFMSDFAVYMREHPGDRTGHVYEKVDFVRPGDKVFAFEEASVDGFTYYHVRKGKKEGWSRAYDLVKYNGAKVAARRNNYGSPYGNAVYAPNSVFISQLGEGMKDTNVFQFEVYGVHTKDFDKAIMQEDYYLYIWGGTPYFDAFDMRSTHFVGDSETLVGIDTSDEVMITDEFGGAFYYEKVRVYDVNSQGIGLNDGINYWDDIVRAGEEEKVVFQITDDFRTSRIVEFVREE